MHFSIPCLKPQSEFKMYKVSNYNYIIDYKGKKLFFNGVKGSGMCMSMQEWDNTLVLLENLLKFGQEYPTEFDMFINMGYLVDEEMDELAYLKHMNKVATYKNRSYQLFINPTLECNFQCWYCYEEHNKGHMTKDTIEAIKKHIKRKVESHEISSLTIGWFGGEPLLYFEEVVYPISKFAESVCRENNIPFFNSATTNAYCINKKMAENMKDIGLYGFQITLDGNQERHDKIRNCNGEPTYNQIIKNINLLFSVIPDARITLRINYDNVTFNSNMEDLLQEFPASIRPFMFIDLHRVWQTFGTTEAKVYIQEENAALNSFVTKAKILGYRCHCNGALTIGRFYGCYACKTNFACINYDGKVYKCTACSFTDEECVGKMENDGTILWNEARISRLYGFSPLEDKKCKECKYLPICMGPCPKHYMNNGYKVECVLDNSERRIEDRIVDLYEEMILSKNMKNTTE